MINFRKSLRSFVYAIRGIIHLFKTENNARFHLLASALVLFFSFLLKITANEWLWIVLSITLVWIAEAINTAIEKLVDFISPHYDKRAGDIKDLAAGAVLIAAIFSVIVAFFIFIPKIL